MDRITLFQGDCLELLNDIPDGSVDMVLCDLPYGTTNYKWDTALPIPEIWCAYRRILKKPGVVALFCTEPFATNLRVSQMAWYKYDWIWKKNVVSGFIHAKNMPMRNYENISIFSNAPIGHASRLGDRRMLYNPQGLTECEIYSNGIRHCGSGLIGRRPSHKAVIKQEFTGYPKMLIEFPSEKGLHPSQKPVPLLEYLIRTYTNPGMTVLDNCMGSGSTGVACINTGRNFIGMELDPGYFEMAKQRIEKG